MSLRIIPTSSDTPGFCSWCETFLRREPSDDTECLVQSQDDIRAAAKRGCFICGWLVLTVHLDTLNSLCLNVPNPSDNALVSISYTDSPKPQWADNRRQRIFNVFDYKDYSRSPSLFEPPGSLQLNSFYFQNLVTKWMETCNHCHQSCKKSMVVNNTFLPSRLVKINNKRSVQLVCASDLDGTVDYVALSHRWETSQPLKLLQGNLNELRTTIKMKDLPATYKMAITACKALQIQYLWIDSLCIIQDSEEDWQKEAATMHLVYGNSTLNICMPVDDTLRDANLIKPLGVRLEQEGEPTKAAYMVCARTCHKDLFFSPLRARGWVFQELSLSRRSLIMGCVQIWWQCHEQLACETFPEGTDYGTRFGPGVLEKSELRAMKLGDSEANFDYFSSPYDHWWNMVEQYAGSNLTYETDRVIAFSGIAQAFRLLHNIQGQYLAGIWSLNLPEGLLWYRHSQATSRPNHYRAPSWSWMSIDGPLIMSHGGEYASRLCCSIQQIYQHPKDEKHDTSFIDGSALRICGHLVGPTTGGPSLGEDILMCHVKTEEIAINGICIVNEDEKGLDKVSFISYLEGLDQDSTEAGLASGAFRRTVAFSEAKGSIFCLPISHCDENPGFDYDPKLCGLVLYNPSHQPGIYHRIGYYKLFCGGSVDFETLLREEHPPQSILIY